uniref:hypothetical protein n=1 Tax=uncultured Ruegeria sp. TaxID=259304 RepID=UPI00261359DF
MSKTDSVRNLMYCAGQTLKFLFVGLRPSRLAAAATSTTLLATGAIAQVIIVNEVDSQQKIDADVDVTITPTGNVQVANEEGGGVVVSADYSSTFTNNGTISAETESVPLGSISFRSLKATALTFGGDILADGQVIINGTINASATSDIGVSQATGIDFDGAFEGALTIDGEINVEATSDNTIFLVPTSNAEGVSFDDLVAGDITNTGAIKVVALSEQDSALAKGVSINEGSQSTSTIRNDGLISSTASTEVAQATAFGIVFGKNLGGLSSITNSDGNLINNGTVSATANSVRGDAIASVYSVPGDLSGDIANGGTLTGAATASEVAEARGVSVSGDMSGDLSNAGLVSARATGGVEAKAVGV